MKSEKITSLINFKVDKDSISSGNNKTYFYRIYPPNLSIMTSLEKDREVQKFQGLLDAVDIPFQLIALDKVEDFEENKRHFLSISDQYQYYREAIVNKISSIEVSESSSIQRAYYFVLQPPSGEKKKQFESALENQIFQYHLALKDELIVILRNYNLREFISSDILVPDVQEDISDPKKFIQIELTRRLMPVSLHFNDNIYYGVQNGFLRKTILIKNFPSVLSTRCYLSELSQIKNTTFSMRMWPMTDSLADIIDRQVNNERSNPLKRKKISELIKSDINQSSMEKFYRSSQERNSQAYRVNIYIEIYGKDEKELKDNFSVIRSKLKSKSISFDELPHEQCEGYQSVSPLGADKFSACANNLPTNTLSNLFPLSHSGRNDPEGILLGETVDGGDIFLDFYNWNSEITNGNFSIIGIPGMGKSWLMKKILSQHIFSGISTFVIDPEAEYGEMFHMLNGTEIDCADGRIKINPFEVRKLRSESDEEDDEIIEAFRQGKMLYQHLSWLKDFFCILYPEAGKLQLKSMMVLVQELYELMGINESTNFAALKSADYPTFTNLYKYIEKLLLEYDQKPHKLVSEESLKAILLMIKDSYDGSLGFIFNGITNIPNSKHICFNIRDLLDGSEERLQAAIFNIMSYVWSRIVLKEDRICLTIDELALLMNRKNYTVASYLKSFCKRGRKYNAGIGAATQNISDYLDKEIYHLSAPIFNNSTFKFVFYPDTVEREEVQRLLKLTEGEMNRVMMAKKGHCLLKAGNQSCYIKVGCLPYEKELFGKGGGR